MSTENESDVSPLRSVHTSNFPGLLAELRCSLLVTTYQAGKLIIVRGDGDNLNTHFRVFRKPMGLAANGAKLVIGTALGIEDYRNIPALIPKIEPTGQHDACYVLRNLHVTGDIDIHEMAMDREGAVWAVNTRFSCLTTLDTEHSFVPRWRPPFVSALAPEDRCHLNGLSLVNGKPKYTTALGETDTPQGWRASKADGGILMDIDTQEVIARGLSMPHSPRWYAEKLWVLESGKGSLTTVNTDTGRSETVTELPGFTRGLDFYGPLAFVGLSQVRESAVFSGIPLTERLKERTCGVWVVHLQTGNTVAFLRFEAAVQEIFAVQVLPDIRFPEVLEPDDTLMSSSYVLPDEALAEVPEGTGSPQAPRSPPTGE